MTKERADDGTTIRLTHRIGAPPETVFEFLTDPDLLLRWMGTRADLEPQPGGRFWLDVNGNDIAAGSYVVVDRPHLVVFTWGWEGSADVPPGSTTVTISLTADGGDTVLELTHAGLPSGTGDDHESGWAYFLPRLDTASGGGTPGPIDMGADPASDQQPPKEGDQ